MPPGGRAPAWMPQAKPPSRGRREPQRPPRHGARQHAPLFALHEGRTPEGGFGATPPTESWEAGEAEKSHHSERQPRRAPERRAWSHTLQAPGGAPHQAAACARGLALRQSTRRAAQYLSQRGAWSRAASEQHQASSEISRQRRAAIAPRRVCRGNVGALWRRACAVANNSAPAGAQPRQRSCSSPASRRAHAEPSIGSRSRRPSPAAAAAAAARRAFCSICLACSRHQAASRSHCSAQARFSAAVAAQRAACMRHSFGLVAP